MILSFLTFCRQCAVKHTSIFFHKIPLFVATLTVLLFCTPTSALTFTLPEHAGDVVGHIQTTHIEPGESFSSLGRRYDVGYYELIEANPNVNPDAPKPWSMIVIPTEYVLPPGPRKGIVINLAELRLYYYPKDKNVVETFPVGIGRQGWVTPQGITKITHKIKDPTWYVPKSVREDRAKEGVNLPWKVPPGPDNPLGKFAMRLSLPSYLIHGTNDPSGVGRRSSAGCVRMFPEDVKHLFKQAGIGMPVRIVDMPYKAGWQHGELYLEAHVPLQEDQAKQDELLQKLIDSGDAYSLNAVEQTEIRKNPILAPMVGVIEKAIKDRHADVDWHEANRVAFAENGIPEVIGYRQDTHEN